MRRLLTIGALCLCFSIAAPVRLPKPPVITPEIRQERQAELDRDANRNIAIIVMVGVVASAWLLSKGRRKE